MLTFLSSIGVVFLVFALALVVVMRLPPTHRALQFAKLTPAGRIRVACLAWTVRIASPLLIRILTYPRAGVTSVERLIVATEIGNANIDVYRPDAAGTGPLPVHFHVHGGGFFVGDLVGDTPWCKYVASSAGCVVINIDYSLAPHQVFPAQVIQCHDVIGWVVANAGQLGIDPQRMSLGGDSAGGNLAVSIALLAIERARFALRSVVSAVPIFDLDSDPEDKSVAPNGKQELTPETIRLVQDVYIPDKAQRRHPLASPLFSDRLAELPQLLIVSARKDILYADAVAFETKARAAGAQVAHVCVEGVDHGFLHVGQIEPMTFAWDVMVGAIKTGHESPASVQSVY